MSSQTPNPRVLLLENDHGIALDIALGAIPFEERSVARASAYDFADGCRLTTCGAEDLLVHKCFAGRDRDWADVEGILIRNHSRLDFSLIRSELTPLAALKEDSDILPRLERKIQQVLGQENQP